MSQISIQLDSTTAAETLELIRSNRATAQRRVAQGQYYDKYDANNAPDLRDTIALCWQLEQIISGSLSQAARHV